jgi:hypothetical protein
LLAHWPAVSHGWPRPFFPQLICASMQTMPGAQSSGRVHVELQLPVVGEHANGAQGRGPPAMQAPEPSQRLALISVVALMQLDALQMVPAT